MKTLIPTIYHLKIDLGGSTRPWMVSAFEVDDFYQKEGLYIVKLFTINNVLQQPCIAKEFICNMMAKEFDLYVPECGLINLNSLDFWKTLPRGEKQLLKKRFQGNTYASEYVAAPLVTENSFSNVEEMAMLYAFDCFILNVDRFGFHKKPNVLLHGDSLMLIDHELSLPMIDEGNSFEVIISNFLNNKLIFPYEKHLFYNALRLSSFSEHLLFDTFHEYLINLNLSKVRNYIYELMDNDINVGNFGCLFDYLTEIKSHSVLFCELLIRSLR